MEFTERDAFEALGLPADGGQGEKEREAADPAPETTAEGDQEPREREAANPAGQDEPAGQDLSDAEGGGEDGGDAAPEGEKAPMTKQQRQEAAAARRRQEQQAAVDEAVAKALQAERAKNQEELTAFFRAAKLKNTITGDPITSMDEFNAWREAFEAGQLQQNLKAGKLSMEDLERAIERSPSVQRARELAEREDAAKRETAQAEFQAKVAAEMAEIQKMDPTIQTVADLLKMPTAKEFYAYVSQHKLSFLDAFRLANRERLANQTAEAARQQALSAARSKDHLSPARQQGAGAAPVPEEELRLFRLLNPGASEQDIQTYYNKYKGK